MFVNLEEVLLRRLVTAQEAGKPLTFAALGMEAHSSTFEDLFADRRIVVKGKEDIVFPLASPSSEIVASDRGKWWLECIDAKSKGEKPPPPPKSGPVFLCG